MIISASRRTDIPAWYTDWFFRRLEEKYVFVRNPMSYNQVSKVSLLPEIVDCIVFWTKNPKPMLDKLHLLEGYPYYFQFALNPYGRELESDVPPKSDDVIPTFQKLSDKIGPLRVVWRYSPFLLSDNYTMDYHVEYFEKLCRRLEGYTKKCMLSFLDMYPKIVPAMSKKRITVPSDDEKLHAAKHFAQIANEYDIVVEGCSELFDLKPAGVSKGKCIDDALIKKITGLRYDIKKDKGQRMQCGCVTSVDIGAYSTCINGCGYCYANHSIKRAKQSYKAHDKCSPMLCSALLPDDKVTERSADSHKMTQLRLF